MESYCIYFDLGGGPACFHAAYFRDLFTLLCVVVGSLYCCIFLHCVTLSLFLHPLMDMGTASTFRMLWFICHVSVNRCLFSLLPGEYLVVDLPGPWTTLVWLPELLKGPPHPSLFILTNTTGDGPCHLVPAFLILVLLTAHRRTQLRLNSFLNF